MEPDLRPVPRKAETPQRSVAGGLGVLRQLEKTSGAHLVQPETELPIAIRIERDEPSVRRDLAERFGAGKVG